MHLTDSRPFAVSHAERTIIFEDWMGFCGVLVYL